MKNVLRFVSTVLFTAFSLSLMAASDEKAVIERLKVPKGFAISVYADGLKTARQMAVSPSGIVYVGSFRAGELHAIHDANNDGIAEKKWLLAKKLRMPTGIAYKDGDLYVGVVDKILRFPNIDKNLDNPQSEVFFDDLPSDRHHGWKYLTFAPNGDLIIPVGAPCNICELSPKYGRIFSLNMKTKKLTTLAEGVRNTVGFDFHPSTAQLWFSDNGRDMMGDDLPPCEINKLSFTGEHFGYPYYHGGSIADPEFAKSKNAKKMTDYTAPQLNLGAHVAPLGIHFYRGQLFPKQYKNQLFVAEHGSWNRTKKAGYKVGLVRMKGDKVTRYEDFITGFMANEVTYGRPVDVVELKDGSILVSDDYADQIYRVSFNSK